MTRRWIMTGFALALVAGACGDSQTTSPDTTTAVTPPTTAVAESTTAGPAVTTASQDETPTTTGVASTTEPAQQNRRCGLRYLQDPPPNYPIVESDLEPFSADPPDALGFIFAAETGFVVFSEFVGIQASSSDGRVWQTHDMLSPPSPESLRFVPRPSEELWERLETLGLGGELKLQNGPVPGNFDLCLDGSTEVWRLPFSEDAGWADVRLVGATPDVVVLVVTERMETPLLFLDGRYEMVANADLIDTETGEVFDLEADGEGGWDLLSPAGEVVENLSGEEFINEMDVALTRRDATSVPDVEYLTWSTDPAAAWSILILPGQSPEVGAHATQGAVGADGTVVLGVAYSPGRLATPEEALSIMSRDNYETLKEVDASGYWGRFVSVTVAG